jgi:hypothetical protein
MEEIRPYSELALEAIEAAGIPAMIGQSSHEVVTLERLARAGGSTNWYVLRTAGDVGDLADRLSPGSAVSFYFDGRLGFHDHSSETVQAILEIVERDRDAVVGRHEGQGWALRELNSRKDDFTGRTMRWHPGGGRHGPNPYWRTTGGSGGYSARIPARSWGPEAL